MSDFGTWADGTSDLIYRGAMGYLLDGLPVGRTVVDLGGANGLSRTFLPGRQVTTVDTDPSHRPDVVASAFSYQAAEPVDTVFIRYLLHYFNDGQVRDLFAHVATWHAGNVVVVQFANNHPRQKRFNSADSGPARHWRTPRRLLRLLDTLATWQREGRTNRLSYVVWPEFYTSRLGHPGRYPHEETVLACQLVRL